MTRVTHCPACNEHIFLSHSGVWYPETTKEKDRSVRVLMPNGDHWKVHLSCLITCEQQGGVHAPYTKEEIALNAEKWKEHCDKMGWKEINMPLIPVEVSRRKAPL